MRENFQWAVACAANSVIYANDLHDAVRAVLDLIMGMLL